MGFIINKYKKNGIEFDFAYASISKLEFDNNAKVAKFTIAIYSNKEDKNLINEINPPMVCKIEDGVDMLLQCYSAASKYATYEKFKAVRLRTSASLLDDSDPNKSKLELEADTIESSDLICLYGSVSDNTNIV